MQDLAQITAQYTKLEPVYKDLGERVHNDIESFLRESQNLYHLITHRSKEVKKFTEKISRKGYDEPFIKMTDLAGIRVITYTESQLPVILEYILEKYNVYFEDSSNKSNDLGETTVGYKSHHFVCAYKDDDLKKPEYEKFKELKFEIQVRTLLQHAWAEVEHDAKYKAEGKLPSDLKRRFNLIAGNLELMDQEIDRLVNEIKGTAINVASAKVLNLDSSVTQESLLEYIRIYFSDAITKAKIDLTEITTDFMEKELTKYQRYSSGKMKILLLRDLDCLISGKLEERIIGIPGLNLTCEDLLRLIMIIDDYPSYYFFTQNIYWDMFDKPGVIELLQRFQINIAKLLKMHDTGAGVTYPQRVKFFGKTHSSNLDTYEMMKKTIEDVANNFISKLGGDEKYNELSIISHVMHYMRDLTPYFLVLDRPILDGLVWKALEELGHIPLGWD